ncbi:MAG: cytochrome c biogenesis protein CcsA [Acidobacteriota bacterium]
MKRLTVPILSSIAAVGFVVTIWMVFEYAPLADVLFFNQKIFYYHVAHAFMLFLSVTICGVCSLVFLKKRDPRWDDVALAAAEIAVAFGAVVLLTGMIWAKAAWDIWWTWEKRLTMSLLLWLTLVGYVLVRRFAGASGERLAAGLAVFGTAGIPFIYTMVDKGDHHPQAGPQGNVATLGPEMQLVFLLSVLTFLCWFLALLISRVQSARAEREVRELRERGLDLGVLQ